MQEQGHGEWRQPFNDQHHSEQPRRRQPHSDQPQQQQGAVSEGITRERGCREAAVRHPSSKESEADFCRQKHAAGWKAVASSDKQGQDETRKQEGKQW